MWAGHPDQNPQACTEQLPARRHWNRYAAYPVLPAAEPSAAILNEVYYSAHHQRIYEAARHRPSSAASLRSFLRVFSVDQKRNRACSMNRGF